MTKSSFKNVEEYREYIKERISKITPILQQAAVGNFSNTIKIPEEEDEFSELLVGLNLMMEDLKTLEEERKRNEEERKKREEERKKRIEDLEKWKELVVQRESRMIELKEEINRLKEKLEGGTD